MDFKKYINSKGVESNKPNVVHIPELNGWYYLISDTVYLIKRSFNVESEFKHIDIFGKGWAFFKANNIGGNISIFQNEKVVNLGSQIVGFVPGQNVIEWRLQRGHLEFELIVCEKPLEISVPVQPVAWGGLNSKKNLLELFEDVMNSTEALNTIKLSRSTQPSHLALKAQDWLHKNWQHEVKIANLAKSLNTSPSVLSRYFKAAFGLTPLKYVNQIRVVSSVRELLKNQRSVAEISYDMGFSDARQFNEHFRKIFPTSPSAFKKIIEMDNPPF